MSKKKKKSNFGAAIAADVERRDKQGGQYGYLKLPKGLNMFKVEKDGRVYFDIIPYVVSDKKHMDHNPDVVGVGDVGHPWYKKPYLAHRGVGTAKESLVCPRTVGKSCPICEAREKQLREGVPYEDALDKAQLRNLYLVIPRGNKEYDEEVHLFDISEYLFQRELDQELREDPDEWGRVLLDLEDGETLKVRFVEESFGKNKYYEASRIDPDGRHEEIEDGADELYDLDDILEILTYAQIEAKFLEIDEEEEEAEEEAPFEEDKPKRKKKKARPEPEEEEEEEEEKPKKRKPRKKVEEEPEEEEEEPEEEEEEAKPKKKKKKKASEDECPEGFDFGTDWDEYDECDSCPVSDACLAKNEELED